jgi:hypothetical protein
MGSAALDGQTNFAVGYSVSGTNLAPSIRYAGRLATDPTNSLSQGETTLQAGGGSQTGFTRWGDYSMLAVDPNDDCTFWYTTEYYSADSAASWRTRIGSFKFPSCTPPPKGTLTGTIKDATSGLPVPNAVVDTGNGFVRTTGNAGTYSMTVAPGTFNMTAAATGYAPSNATGVAVSGGSVVTQNFTLARIALPVFFSSAVNDSAGNNNGQIDPNECALINVVVTNKGKATASAVTATLGTALNSPATDQAGNAAYNDGWQSGDNGGTGFGAWQLSAQINGNNAGFFVGDSDNNGCFNDGFGVCPPCGPGINTAGKAWGLYANTSTLAEAIRPFAGGAILAGQSFSIDMDNGCLDGVSTSAGF